MLWAAQLNERLTRRRGPLSDSYVSAVALVVFALVPFLALTGAVVPLLPTISRSLGLSRSTLDVTIGMSNAAYAFGTVMAVQFAVHLRGRRMLLVYVSSFVMAAVLAAWAPTGGVFIGAFIAEGLCTSLMLIAAVPPLVIGWPASKMPWTGLIMNLCIFGAVAVGPTLGGLQAASGGWRPLFWIVAGIGALALVFAILTFEDQPPQDREAPWDLLAVALAGGGCAAAFFGASELEATKVAGIASLGPLLAGVTMITALVGHQYYVRRPLMPVRQLGTTLPVIGILIAVCGSASAFGLMALVLQMLEAKGSPAHTAFLFLPEFVAAILAAGVFGALFRTRFTPVFAVFGLIMLSSAAAVLTGVVRGGDMVVAVGSALIGLGVGASVSPALYIAGFTLRSSQLQRIFALIELLRGVAAFLAAPLLVYLATAVSAAGGAGLERAVYACLALAAAGGVIATILFLLGRGRLQRPNLEQWAGGEPAWESPALLIRVRDRGPRVPPSPEARERPDAELESVR